MIWTDRPIFRFTVEDPCLLGRVALWTVDHGRLTSTVTFLLFLVAFGLALAR